MAAFDELPAEIQAELRRRIRKANNRGKPYLILAMLESPHHIFGDVEYLPFLSLAAATEVINHPDLQITRAASAILPDLDQANSPMARNYDEAIALGLNASVSADWQTARTAFNYLTSVFENATDPHRTNILLAFRLSLATLAEDDRIGLGEKFSDFMYKTGKDKDALSSSEQEIVAAFIHDVLSQNTEIINKTFKTLPTTLELLPEQILRVVEDLSRARYIEEISFDVLKRSIFATGSIAYALREGYERGVLTDDEFRRGHDLLADLVDIASTHTEDFIRERIAENIAFISHWLPELELDDVKTRLANDPNKEVRRAVKKGSKQLAKLTERQLPRRAIG